MSRGAITPESCIISSPRENRGRRECRVLAATHGPPGSKKPGGSHHRFSRIIRHSLRDGFNGVLRALPRNRAFLLLSPRGSQPRDLTSASGGQDHTLSLVRTSAARPARTDTSIASRTNVRDDREAPLCGRDAARQPLISEKRKSNIFRPGAGQAKSA